MSRKIEFYLVDIFIAADKISRYIEKFENAEAFLHSELEWDATIRELEIIGEATNKLLQENMLAPHYRMIVDFRNQIAHGYFGIDEQIVWEVATALLDDFTSMLHKMIQEKKIDLSEAIRCAEEDHHYNSATVAFLKTIS
jgi:uncharacterized protein with HEPN domain